MTNKTGTLYLCATPIGNLEDMTYRVVRTLNEVDVIAAEDTRNSIKLLNHFDIHTPMTSYHEYNKIEKGRILVRQMLEGQNVALITDAGMPGISDPGEELVRMCRDAGVPVTALPGACACVTALVISGQSTRRFCFEAFLPTDKKERKAVLEELKDETRTTVIYEAPHRLQKTLKELLEHLGKSGMDEHAAVRSLFFELPSEERMIIAMHLFCGYSSKEIGKLLDLNENTVRSKESRGIKKMVEKYWK